MITPHGPITSAKAAIFLSEMITSVGTDASPEVHGLGASPSVFFAIFQNALATNPNLAATADATNVYVSAASADVKYIVFAWL